MTTLYLRPERPLRAIKWRIYCAGAGGGRVEPFVALMTSAVREKRVPRRLLDADAAPKVRRWNRRQAGLVASTSSSAGRRRDVDVDGRSAAAHPGGAARGNEGGEDAFRALQQFQRARVGMQPAGEMREAK